MTDTARPLNLEERRFWARVAPASSGCWEWLGSRVNGYGRPHWNGRQIYAYHVTFEMFFGPVPQGLTLDHLCRNRACVNPLHLEPVTFEENILRGESPPARNARLTHCPAGHPYDSSHGYRSPDGRHRFCRTCRAETQRERRARQRQLA